MFNILRNMSSSYVKTQATKTGMQLYTILISFNEFFQWEQSNNKTKVVTIANSDIKTSASHHRVNSGVLVRGR